MIMIYTIGLLLALAISVGTSSKFNQTAGYQVNVQLDTWSNFGAHGGCVTCDFTCVPPTIGPDGMVLNKSDPTLMANLPPAFTKQKRNGCCYAPKGESKTPPSCSAPADPPTAEPCGFLYGPTLEYKITTTRPPADPMSAILFASEDCLNFYTIGRTFVKQDPEGSTSLIEGSEMINEGCYGDPQGVPIVLAGCLTSELKYEKGKIFTWDKLARKCRGLSGQCSRTNGLWGENLKCCTSKTEIIGSAWDLKYIEYHKEANRSVVISGTATFFIVIAGVAFMMCLVHSGAKCRERARLTALMREQEASEDYEEIATPLTGNQSIARTRIQEPSSLEVSLHEGDRIFREEKADEFVYEGNL